MTALIRRLAILAAVVAPAPAPALAQTAPPGAIAGATASGEPIAAPVGDLRAAIVSAYRTNPQLLARRDALRAVDNRLAQARAGYGPTVDLRVSQGYQSDRTDLDASRSLTRSGWTTTATLILNQPVATFGRVRSAEEGALAEIEFGRDSLRLAEAQTLLDVIDAYVSVQRDETLVAIAAENVALLQRQYDDSNERFRVREITVSDLQQVETRLEAGRARLIETRGQLGASRATFLRHVGAAPTTLAAPEPLDVAFGSLGEAQAFADAHSALIRAAQSREKISRAGVEAARAEFGPRVDLRGVGGNEPLTPYGNRLRTESVRGEVVLSMPIFTSGLRRARLGEADESNQGDWRLIDQARRDTRATVAATWDRLGATRQSIGHYAAAIEAARAAYEGALLQERAGARTTLDVLNLARDLLDVRTSYAVAVADEYVARASLLSAAGLLEAPLLLPEVPAWDKKDHLDRVRGTGDVPGLTHLVRALDSPFTPSVRADRESRDAAAGVSIAPQVPVLPTPPIATVAAPALELPATGGRIAPETR